MSSFKNRNRHAIHSTMETGRADRSLSSDIVGRVRLAGAHLFIGLAGKNDHQGHYKKWCKDK
jgi:hypothetical protein